MPRVFRLLPLLCLVPAALPAQEAAQDSALTIALRDCECRHAFRLGAGGELEGPGARVLLDAGRAAHFFMVGEEHGIAEVPRLSAALFRALAPHGYRHLAVEIGSVEAAELNRRALEGDAMANVTGFMREHWPGVAFYGLREEAELLAAAVEAAGRRPDVLWGLDYAVFGDRYALRRLRDLAPGAAARQAAERLGARVDSTMEAALAAGNLGQVFMFAAPDTALSALRAAYAPAAGSEADRILSLLEETLRINADNRAGRGYHSNVRRAALLRRELVRHYRAAQAAGEARPRVMLKFGGNHLVRGRNFTSTFDLGTLAHELAEMDGGSAFGVLALAGRDARAAAIDPRTFGYQEVPTEVDEWARPLYDLAAEEGWTLWDLRPLRPLAAAGRLGRLAPRLTQVIFGYDAVVILTGSGPSHPLVPERPRR